MKRIVLFLCLIISPLISAPDGESFVVEKPKKSKESKRSILEDTAQLAIDGSRLAADNIEILARIQQEVVHIQRTFMDTAIALVTDEYRPKDSMHERDRLRSRVQKIKDAQKLLHEARSLIASCV